MLKGKTADSRTRRNKEMKLLERAIKGNYMKWKLGNYEKLEFQLYINYSALSDKNVAVFQPIMTVQSDEYSET